MSVEEARRAKRNGSLPGDYASEGLPSFVADMGQQIDRSLQFFFSAVTQYTHIDQIILAGGCAQIDGLDAQIQERLQVPTVIARPFAQMSVSRSEEHTSELQSLMRISYAVFCLKKKIITYTPSHTKYREYND